MTVAVMPCPRPHLRPHTRDRQEPTRGIDHILLTHRDDIADAQRYAEYFDARVWIHDGDLGGGSPR